MYPKAFPRLRCKSQDKSSASLGTSSALGFMDGKPCFMDGKPYEELFRPSWHIPSKWKPTADLVLDGSPCSTEFGTVGWRVLLGVVGSVSLEFVDSGHSNASRTSGGGGGRGVRWNVVENARGRRVVEGPSGNIVSKGDSLTAKGKKFCHFLRRSGTRFHACGKRNNWYIFSIIGCEI